MLKKQIIVILVLCFALSALTACGPQTTNEDGTATPTPETSPAATQTTEPTAEATASPDADNAQRDEIQSALLQSADEVVVTENEVKFQDDSGREPLTIQKNPERVAVLYGSHACLYTEAGGKVSAGVSSEELYLEQIGRDIMKDEGVVTVATSSSGKTWNVEAILAEQPDLIICSTAMSGYATIAGPAEAANIPVIALTYSGVTDYLKWFKVFSAINSDPELWDSVAMPVAEDITDIILKTREASEKPEILALSPGTDALTAMPASSDMGAIIDQLGGINLAKAPDAKSTSVDIDLEQIYALNPEMIFIRCRASEQDAKDALNNWIDGNPVWDSLDAVKNGKVYYMPMELYQYRPNSRYPESYRMLAELLYPEREF